MSTPKLTEAEVATLCPDFTNITEIGSGGFKTVYRAEIHGTDEVIKVVGIPKADSTNATEKHHQERFRDECVRRVEREVGILEKCESPFLVKTGSLDLAAHKLNDFDYVIYSEEDLGSDDLWKILRTRDPTDLPDESEAKLLMKCLLLAIQEIWKLKVIHRDIKPANVMKVDDADRPFVLLDLGIAFSLVETSVTYNAALRGPPATYRYLAPEMGDPNFRANLDFRADLYTAALTTFEYASGQHPIAVDGEDDVRTATRAIRELPKSLEAFQPGFSKPFVKMIDQLLKKRPALRPANIVRLIQITES